MIMDTSAHTTGITMDDSRVNDSADEDHVPGKRKRVTISCLNCKKRKVKCDKTSPCNNCRSRNEIHLCEYEDGREPPPPQTFAVASDVDALRRRVNDLEEQVIRLNRNLGAPSTMALQATGTPGSLHSTPAATGVTPSYSLSQQPHKRAAALEKAFLELDDLTQSDGHPADHSLRLRSRMPTMSKDVPKSFTVWPNILESGSTPICQRPSRWTQAMRENLAAIPDNVIVQSLVDHYFETVSEKLWHQLHEKVFRQELEQFLYIRMTGDPLVIDPGWLVLLFGVLVVGIHALVKGDWVVEAQRNAVADDPTLVAVCDQLDQAFDSALMCAGALHKPQFRVLQGLLIVLNLTRLDDPMVLFPGDKMEPHDTMWFDIAIIICKGLRMHFTGPNFENGIAVDPAFPPDVPLYGQEMASRAVHALAFWDRVLGCAEAESHGNDAAAFRFPEGSLTTPTPRNFLDADLWPPPASPPEPQPIFVRTEIIWQIHGGRITTHWKRISDALRDMSTLDTDMVAAIDKDLTRDDHEFLSLRYSQKLNEAEDLALESLHGSYQQRRLRLHRHFFLRSYVDPTCHFSQAAAISAARSIIKGHRETVDRFGLRIPSTLSLIFFTHHISAAIILFVHGCLAPNSKTEIQNELRLSANLFNSANFGKHVRWRQAVTHGYQVMQTLCNALESPPSTVEAIETFLINIRRDVSKADATQDTAPSAQSLETDIFGNAQPGVQPMTSFLPTAETLSGINFGDGVPSDAQDFDIASLVDFNWDSLFRGF